MDIFNISNFINDLSQQHTALVTKTFLNLESDKKVHILLAIVEEASERGDPKTLNIKKVAERGSIAVGALYKYFTNRDNMISYTIEIIKSYIISAMEYVTEILKDLPLDQALYYFCTGSKEWSESEQKLSYFYYQAAYGNNQSLTETLVKPVSASFLQCLETILKTVKERDSINFNYDIETCALFLYRYLAPTADSMIYTNLQTYLNPKEDESLTLELTIELLQKAIIRSEKSE